MLAPAIAPSVPHTRVPAPAQRPVLVVHAPVGGAQASQADQEPSSTTPLQLSSAELHDSTPAAAGATEQVTSLGVR